MSENTVAAAPMSRWSRSSAGALPRHRGATRARRQDGAAVQQSVHRGPHALLDAPVGHPPPGRLLLQHGARRRSARADPTTSAQATVRPSIRCFTLAYADRPSRALRVPPGCPSGALLTAARLRHRAAYRMDGPEHAQPETAARQALQRTVTSSQGGMIVRVLPAGGRSVGRNAARAVTVLSSRLVARMRTRSGAERPEGHRRVSAGG